MTVEDLIGIESEVIIIRDLFTKSDSNKNNKEIK